MRHTRIGGSGEHGICHTSYRKPTECHCYKNFFESIRVTGHSGGYRIAHPQIIAQLQNDELARPVADSLVKASAALTDQEHIWNSHLLMKQETEFVWEQVQSMEKIEMGARTVSGVASSVIRQKRSVKIFYRKALKHVILT